MSKCDEERCLRIVQKLKKYSDLQGDYVHCERPDFLIGDVGVEHFLVDVVVQHRDKDDSLHSIHRMETGQIERKVDFYKSHPDVLEQDVYNDKAVGLINDWVCNRISGVNEFDYQRFIGNFSRVWDNHYESVLCYREKCKKLGFLIEIRYLENVQEYVIDGDKKRRQRVKGIPITRDMIRVFDAAKDVDFVILCMAPFKNDDNDTKFRNCHVIRVDMDDVESSLRKQGVFICNTFDFVRKNIDLSRFHVVKG